MTNPHSQLAKKLPVNRKRSSEPVRSPKIIYLATAVLILCGCGLFTVPWLRGEKLRLLILRNQIETAAAPEEPVLVDDWLLYRALRWKGSDALQHQLVFVRQNALPAQALAAQQEMVMAVPDDDSLLRQLSGHGLTVAPNVSQEAWVASGKGFHSPGRRPFRIYFIMRPSPGTQPTATPAEP